jgi:hypothetical protein
MQVNQEYCEENTEYCAAVTALVEGDATMVQLPGSGDMLPLKIRLRYKNRWRL